MGVLLSRSEHDKILHVSLSPIHTDLCNLFFPNKLCMSSKNYIKITEFIIDFFIFISGNIIISGKIFRESITVL